MLFCRLAPGPEVIYLRHVERAKPHMPHAEEDRIYPPPQFIIPLRDVSQIEGGRVHFEARIEPVGDPTMRVDWFVNGRPLEASECAYHSVPFVLRDICVKSDVCVSRVHYKPAASQTF
jgi:hypothetical protein